MVNGRTLDKDVPAGGIQWIIKVYPKGSPVKFGTFEEGYLHHAVYLYLVLDQLMENPVKLSVMAEQRGFFARESKSKMQHCLSGKKAFSYKGDSYFDRSQFLASVLRRHKTDH